MGCSESKDRPTKIDVKSASEKLFESRTKILVPDSATPSSEHSSGMGSSASTSSEKDPTSADAHCRLVRSGAQVRHPTLGSGSSTSSSYSAKVSLEDEFLEERDGSPSDLPGTLEAIPNNDLGESLDARKMKRLWARQSDSDVFASTSNGGHSSANDVTQCWSASSSAKSVESSDSGVYEIDDVITENSAEDLVRRVERDFTPVENIDLTISGQACPRLLSGSQRVRREEKEILEDLRQEGFISTSRQRASGGLAFEVVEDNPIVESAGGKIKPMNFLPKKHREHLDKHINKFHLKDLTSADVERRQFLAEERRRLESEAKLEKLSNLMTKSNVGDKVEEIKKKKDQKLDAALEKREAHLRELRDKLKAQNKKAKQIKLKKLINDPPVPVPFDPSQKTQPDNDKFFND